jgi:hypothetical protein
MKNFNIESIIERNELHYLLSGEQNFLIDNYSDFDEPQNFEKLWRIYLVPYLKEKKGHESVFVDLFFEALTKILNDSSDLNKSIYICITQIPYLYINIRKHQINIKITPPNALIDTIIKLIKNNKETLINDFRWSGATWNKANEGQGVYGALKKFAFTVKELFPELYFDNAFI